MTVGIEDPEKVGRDRETRDALRSQKESNDGRELIPRQVGGGGEIRHVFAHASIYSV
jgi:hypothetical protein